MYASHSTWQHFNPRSPHGERRILAAKFAVAHLISTHAPRTGSDRGLKAKRRRASNFNPRSPHGERQTSVSRCPSAARSFQPTLPARGATVKIGAGRSAETFQPTLPARGATSGIGNAEYCSDISTHAPRTGSDQPATEPCASANTFQPTLPARGATATSRSLQNASFSFQPTLPARGATCVVMVIPPSCGVFQPTLPARGATRPLRGRTALLHISTHAPRTGSDPRSRCRGAASWDFNPRSPHGERLRYPAHVHDLTGISTHAPRTGSDGAPKALPDAGAGISTHAPRTGSDDDVMNALKPILTFQPTLPARGATFLSILYSFTLIFQPTLPARGATIQAHRVAALVAAISTHAPRTGSDQRSPSGQLTAQLFQPTLPARGATVIRRELQIARQISTHAPRTGSDSRSVPSRSTAKISTHAPRTGSDTPPAPCSPPSGLFQPTLPARGATAFRDVRDSGRRISTHAPRTGSDIGFKSSAGHPAISTHAPRTGSDLSFPGMKPLLI